MPRNLGQDGDVGFGLADLSRSIFSGLGLPSVNNALDLPPSERTCLLLVDGMGYESLLKYSHEFEIFTALKNLAILDSHFPSTTVTNLTSLGTGELPGVHGMLGYTVRVPHSGVPGRLLNPLKWDDRVDPLFWQPLPTLFERASAEGITVSHVAERRYEGSAFTQAALRGADYVGANRITEIIEETKRVLANPRSFAYVYTNALDHAGHNDGVGSEKWLLALGQVATLIAKLREELPAGTDFYVTADHGMVNVGRKIILGKDNDLMENVALLGGEPRARHVYLKDPTNTETYEYWREFLKSDAVVYSKSEVIEAELFGEKISEDSFNRMGDLIAIAQSDSILIDPSRVPQESAMVGHHGGVTRIESAIPLLKAF